MKDIVGLIIDFTHELHELDERISYSIGVHFDGDKKVHIVDNSAFFKLFNTYDIKKWNIWDSDIYGEAHTEVEGVKFSTCINHKDVDKYIGDTSVNKKIQAHIALASQTDNFDEHSV